MSRRAIAVGVLFASLVGAGCAAPSGASGERPEPWRRVYAVPVNDGQGLRLWDFTDPARPVVREFLESPLVGAYWTEHDLPLGPTGVTHERTVRVVERAILDKFPPSKWSIERLREMQRRSVVEGVYPNAEEQEFIDHLDEWKAAMKAFHPETDVDPKPR